ncbi:hypothetical protein LshimejAT787_0503800 [Lyophyllum shimeji]|uniref:Uncharacterized protein n=1 Tax=Lyophyllum shimeji TaxID=47721 RepID=A0A9P3UP21_LYOSH|nr:hypothetical protein LshimejAT787_0503800 [Lyophyllum shimeji]
MPLGTRKTGCARIAPSQSFNPICICHTETAILEELFSEKWLRTTGTATIVACCETRATPLEVQSFLRCLRLALGRVPEHVRRDEAVDQPSTLLCLPSRGHVITRAQSNARLSHHPHLVTTSLFPTCCPVSPRDLAYIATSVKGNRQDVFCLSCKTFKLSVYSSTSWNDGTAPVKFS